MTSFAQSPAFVFSLLGTRYVEQNRVFWSENMANRLFVGNLSFNTSEDALRALFADHRAENVRIMTDRETGRSRGFAFIDFADGASAARAMQSM